MLQKRKVQDAKRKTVIPAYAGIQLSNHSEDNSQRLLKTFVKWIPAFAGMTMLLLLFTLTFTLYVSPAYAADPAPCSLSANSQEYKDDVAKFGPCPAGLAEIEKTVGNIVSVVVYLGFIAMLVLIVTAGFKYLTSGGEPKAIQSAHYTLTWALLGLTFFAVAWIILQLLQGFTGIPVTNFNIKSLCGTGGIQFCPTPPP